MRSVKDYLAEANATVEKIDPERATALIERSDPLILDVRDPQEVAEAGRIAGAHNVPRGMLEFRADPDSPFHDPSFDRDRPVLVYCASGGRAALAGKVLQEMGFAEVYNLGGFRDWTAAGGKTEPAA